MDVMNFGKYEGVSLDSVPVEYLVWCAENLSRCPIVVQELDRRGILDSVQGKAVDKYLRAKESPVTCKGTVVGDYYQSLRDEWELAGGSEEQCPFGEDYVGPTICWAGGKPVLVPSEFDGGW